VRVQNDYLPLVPTLKWEPAPEEQDRLKAGIRFERNVFAHLRALHPNAVVVAPEVPKSKAITMTVQAMDTSAPLILGGWLPDDIDSGRTGRPDILIKVGRGYLPADVKNHLTMQCRKIARVVISPVESPGERLHLTGWTAATSHRYEDGLQLAHYTRMLQACGYHSGPDHLWGAIVGTSQVAVTPNQDPGLAFAWHDLNEPLVSTFSRSRGKVRRSLLERYDHEHTFRVKVAATAREVIGGEHDPQPLVEPIGQNECSSCPYEEWCRQQMGPDDPSTVITIGRLGTREWLTLRRMGVSTTESLSVLDSNDPVFFDDYVAEVSHLTPGTARKRLASAIERAEMICAGVDLKRTSEGPLEIPAADIEVDVDIEYDLDNRVYMWGARPRVGIDEASATYVDEFVEWMPLDSDREKALAARFADWLRYRHDEAQAAGRTLKVFHWSSPERSKLKSILGAAEVADLMDAATAVFVDLEKVFKANFLSVHGSSLKVVARLFGFTWRVDDPGGAISQTYLSKVRTSAEPDEVAEAKQWLLTYNEDDNAAMAAIRDGMRAWTP
ncbi:ribonuclease H-like domain-containing protein, partial [Mycobacterium sp. 1165178.9]|uniref:ribonuclease H-like domain-containing protein n=1 Tax=Mycobacterium sp. 1165178.9 TaxID=1834070 RepID=UPI00080072CB